MTNTKLTIETCSLSGGSIKPDSRGKFAVQINPAKITHNRSIEYAEGATPPGHIGDELKFKRIPSETLSLEIVLDGTGVVPVTGGKSVQDQVDALMKVVYTYVGDKHETNYVRLGWGASLFTGRLTAMNTTYTLFKPGGEPLRATVNLTFKSAMGLGEERATANRSSPDLSHVIEVREGDTLPLLCLKVYGDARHYAEVARFNGLSSFRRLAPGARLHFPPLD